jgi:FkbM family methyltransferase
MTDQEVHSGQLMFAGRKHAVYQLLTHVQPGLFVDVGAAAGVFTKMMLSMNPGSRSISFEPYPGNFSFFERTVGADPRVTLRRAAVSNREGEVSFFVASVVQGAEPGWEDYKGYSSLGFIVGEQPPRTGATIQVPAVRLDTEIKEHVRFCKIDVQGGETAVLEGADALIRTQGVDMFYIEFGGEDSILDFLQERDYVFFDHLYLLVATRKQPDPADWRIEAPVKLSTGKEAFSGWPRSAPRPTREYCAWLREQSKQIGGVWTDMVCVHRSYLPAFLTAAAQAMRVPG